DARRLVERRRDARVHDACAVARGHDDGGAVALLEHAGLARGAAGEHEWEERRAILHVHVVAEDALLDRRGAVGRGCVGAQQPHRTVERHRDHDPVQQSAAEIAEQRGAGLAGAEAVERVAGHAVEQRQRVAAGDAERGGGRHAPTLVALGPWRNLCADASFGAFLPTEAHPMPVTQTSLAELLEQLVDIPSVTGNEQEIVDWLTRRLAATSRGEAIRHGLSIVWRAPRKGRPLVVLAGHTDTVPPQGNAKAQRNGDRISGLGTTDMKSGDAVALALAESLDLDALRFDLACVFYDAEEGPADRNALKRVTNVGPGRLEGRRAVVREPHDAA